MSIAPPPPFTLLPAMGLVDMGTQKESDDDHE
jgi:hypothetical protein